MWQPPALLLLFNDSSISSNGFVNRNTADCREVIHGSFRLLYKKNNGMFLGRTRFSYFSNPGCQVSSLWLCQGVMLSCSSPAGPVSAHQQIGTLVFFIKRCHHSEAWQTRRCFTPASHKTCSNYLSNDLVWPFVSF